MVLKSPQAIIKEDLDNLDGGVKELIPTCLYQLGVGHLIRM